MADETEKVEETSAEETSTETEETETEEKKEETTPPGTKEKEPMVPLHRFRETNDKLEKVEKEIADLRQQKFGPGISDEQQKELQAKNYLKTLLKEQLDEERLASEAKESAEFREFEKSVDEILETHPSVQRKDFVDFMEKNAEKYGIESVPGAMKLYLDLGNLSKQAKEEGKKEIQKKPGLPRSEGAGGGEQAPAEDKNKSYAQVVQDAIRSLRK